MANTPFLGGAQALLGPGLLAHELHKVLEGQGRSVEPFEWEGFEELGALDDEPGTRFGRQVQGDPLTGQGPSYIVVFQIDAHRAIAADRAHQVQAVADFQPAIGVDQIRYWRQFGQGGKRSTRRKVATTEPLVGTLIVVMLPELLGDLAHLVESPWTMHGQTFGLIAAVIALDEAVGPSRQLHRLPL
jgi:hypothetical protein